MFNLAQDMLTGIKELPPLPAVLQPELGLLTSFMKHCQLIIATISRTLALQLSLPADTFSSLQSPTKPSGTALRMIKSFASPRAEDQRTSMVHHTDFGTITLLANLLGGLQVLNPDADASDENAWSWVRPQPGCLIVNLGDALVQWTGGLLRSNVHRIRYPPGEQVYHDRYSFAVLGRPELNASMKRMVGPASEEDSDMTAWEWELKKRMSIIEGKAFVTSPAGKALRV